MAPGGEIAKKLLLTFADGVVAGKIDVAKVDATIAQLSTSAATVHGCSIEALNKLHAILSPAERAALVDKVQAHWEVWRHVNHDAEGGGREQGGHLAELARELNLTEEQVEKISASLRTAFTGLAGKFDPKKVEAHVQAFATAFVGESFDAKSVTADANAHLATHGSNRMALFYETVTPLLTPEQRTKLAAHLREHASHQPKAK
jgi:Spy/CpxP family protein refolding chaperone